MKRVFEFKALYLLSTVVQNGKNRYAEQVGFKQYLRQAKE